LISLKPESLLPDSGNFVEGSTLKHFYQLTYRGRARRLRQMALRALEEYDLSLKRLRLLTNETNCIFRIDATDGSKFILRITDPMGAHSLEEVLSEMQWVAALQQDTNLGVPEPVLTRKGSPVVTILMDGVPEPRHCAVFSWVPGVDLAERLSSGNIHALGQLSAHLHNHAKSFKPTTEFLIRKLDKVFPYSDPSFQHVEPIVIFDERYQNHFPEDRLTIYRLATERVQEALDRLYADPGGMRVTHNDLHQWNVKVYREKLFALDFEDLAWGYPVQDIATTVFYLRGYDQQEQLISAFKRGYTSINAWPEIYPGEIETYMAGRSIMLANYLLCSKNPEDQALVPDYLARVEGRLARFLNGLS
jgi:Ser/Thr protein kinase RdoA (MazF antagonist)